MSNQRSLSYIVDEVLKSFLTFSNIKQIEIKNAVPDNLVNVNGNTDIILLLLVNLIDNAIKYISQQGSIEVGANVSAKDIEVWVRDNGIGIPSELQKKIFDRRYQLNNNEMGKCIGLSVAKRIVNFYGGKIWVESKAGKGSTFIFTIPNRD